MPFKIQQENSYTNRFLFNKAVLYKENKLLSAQKNNSSITGKGNFVF